MKHRTATYCPRSGHKLAWVEADPTGQPVVSFVGIAPGRQSAAIGTVSASATEIRGPDDDPFAGYDATAVCSCGRWSVDLLAVLEGRPQKPTRITDSFPGVSFDRARHRGR